VIPEDSPNTSPDGDFEIDGYANLGAGEFTFLTIWASQLALFHNILEFEDKSSVSNRNP
jgi:hypothetical protein